MSENKKSKTTKIRKVYENNQKGIPTSKAKPPMPPVKPLKEKESEK